MKIDRIIRKLNKKGINFADVAIVCGSGLKEAVPDLTNNISISYKELGMLDSKVKGHNACFTFGEFSGKRVMIAARNHFYETGKMENVRLPFEVMQHLGVHTCVLLTATGGINKTFKIGDVMLILDHINFTGVNPLVGVGEKIIFDNMIGCYDSEFISNVKEIVKSNDIDIRQGVHFQTSGPCYETLAEVEMARMMGADSVSMSTAHDTIILRHFGIRVLGFSSIVNVYNSEEKVVSHEDVLENAQKASQKLKKILSQFIINLHV